MQDDLLDTTRLDKAALKRELKALARRYEDEDLPPWLFDALGLIRLGGEVATPDTLRIGDLKALPSLTQTVTYLSAGSPVTNTYTGVLLKDLIADAGGVTTNPAAKNDILAHYIVATGSDGYRAVFALGEIDPRFGNQAIMVAYDDTEGHSAGSRRRVERGWWCRATPQAGATSSIWPA
jgi:hypothetical protein